ncbi:hypothetical protein BDD21_4645 [Thiocapsa rosea]|uniref:Uncharacterized protein n=1 Tax=Thiocapsa rosea TaxID=69360 RepID=A0A495VE56_9GAMM|nr:hypothetical protein BDD21_4645 [Thiocapsa rosea]
MGPDAVKVIDKERAATAKCVNARAHERGLTRLRVCGTPKERCVFLLSARARSPSLSATMSASDWTRRFRPGWRLSNASSSASSDEGIITWVSSYSAMASCSGILRQLIRFGRTLFGAFRAALPRPDAAGQAAGFFRHIRGYPGRGGLVARHPWSFQGYRDGLRKGQSGGGPIGRTPRVPIDRPIAIPCGTPGRVPGHPTVCLAVND